jgi:hypothetical protein
LSADITISVLPVLGLAAIVKVAPLFPVTVVGRVLTAPLFVVTAHAV